MKLGGRTLVAVVLFSALAFALYLWQVPSNPPGFYIDESSISYNAYTIAESGKDEYGERWPLYFRAFGEHKNPTYVYLLAAVFKIAGPSITVARGLSAVLGALAALLLGILAFKLSDRKVVSFVVTLSALLTPWLYESSRLVFEVAAYPLVCVLFLLFLRHTASQERWDLLGVTSLVCSLALLTYTYSIGRLLGPLLAAGLAFFVTKRNLPRVLITWLAYAVVAIIPLIIYESHHRDALTGRWKSITYIQPDSSFSDIAGGFFFHYFSDINPWRWLVTGESNIRDHLAGSPALLAVTVVLGVAGGIIALKRSPASSCWRFQLYALVVSVIPAALTVTDFPQLRLIGFPVFLHVLAVPAVGWLAGTKKRRVLLITLTALLAVQGAFFQWNFHERPPERWHMFDARFPNKVLEPALEASRGGAIALYDPLGNAGYIQALWYGVLKGIDTRRFVRLPPEAPRPPGAVVVSTEQECSNCRMLARASNYIVYAVEPTDLSAHPAQLDPGSFAASLTPNGFPPSVDTGTNKDFEVIVRNIGDETWPAVASAARHDSVVLRARILTSDINRPVSEPVRARIPFDMEPGDTAGIKIEFTAPGAPGDYWLELAMEQESTASETLPLRLELHVVP